MLLHIVYFFMSSSRLIWNSSMLFSNFMSDNVCSLLFFYYCSTIWRSKNHSGSGFVVCFSPPSLWEYLLKNFPSLVYRIILQMYAGISFSIKMDNSCSFNFFFFLDLVSEVYNHVTVSRLCMKTFFSYCLIIELLC